LNDPVSRDSHSTPFARRKTFTASPFPREKVPNRKAFQTVSGSLEYTTIPSFISFP